MICLINGVETTQLNGADRGLSYGDGCFTTGRIWQGRLALAASHRARLRATAKHLALPFEHWEQLQQEITEICRQGDDGVLKVVLTRGVGGRGYSAHGCQTATRLVMRFALPEYVSTWQAKGVVLTDCRTPLGISPLLAGHKTLNRLEQVLGRQELDPLDADEGIFCDVDGYVVECNSANLFWRVGEQVFTPQLSCAGVNGVMRQQILARLQQLGRHCEQVRIKPDRLAEIDEMFICNSVIGVVPVRRYLHTQLQDHQLARTLQKDNLDIQP